MNRLALALCLVPALGAPAASTEKDVAALAVRIEKYPLKDRPDYGADIRSRRDAFNKKDLEAWRSISSLEDWQKKRRQVVDALRRHVVPEFTPQEKVKHLVTGKVSGDGFVIENIVYESVPGLIVTANLYQPDPPRANPPAILLAHSHHNPKSEGELQDMGMLWARLGCLVLVPDLLGHGERRQHPFKDAKSFPEAFKVGRQDYYFRYNLGVQLAVAGESLAGWMARDLMRGVDLVLQRGADSKSIILMGAVAGGGDPAGLTAAVDERIACVVPFNFGGPQPETRYPLPDDAESWFNYHGGGSWESTRNLAFSASGGFPHWAIVASVAPRRLIHAHEFSWDQERDPVWKRYQKIWAWHDAEASLGFAHGTGLLSGKAPEASHCNNIGAVHRKMIYPYLQKWFGIPAPAKEQQTRVPSDRLVCLSKGASRELNPRTVAELLQEQASRSLNAALAEVNKLDRAKPQVIRAHVRAALEKPLGDVTPWPRTSRLAGESWVQGEVAVSRSVIKDENGLAVASVLLLRSTQAKGDLPVVVGVAQHGSPAFLGQRAEAISRLLDGGAAVALVDVRGTGELGAPGGRGRTSAATSLSALEWMMGRSMLANRLRDLRSAIQHLRGLEGLDSKRLALWGDSFAPVNAADTVTMTPHDAPRTPHQAEPLGPTLARLAALWEDDVQAVYCCRGLLSYLMLFDSHFFHLPHDIFVPRILEAGDLMMVDMAIAPRPFKMEGILSALNQPFEWKMPPTGHPAGRVYEAQMALDRWSITHATSPQREIADWLLRGLVR